METRDEIIELKRYPNKIDADLARQHLDAHGIPCFVTSDDAGGMRLDLQAVHGVRLMVFARDREAAMELLDAMNF